MQDQDSADEEEEGEKKKVQENFCAICQGDEDLIPCSTCVYSFHMECHDPPLKREPRSVKNGYQAERDERPCGVTSASLSSLWGTPKLALGGSALHCHVAVSHDHVSDHET